LASLKVGRAKAERGTEPDRLAGFDVVPTVPVVLNDDIEAAAAPLRSYCALYLGGMGSREKNFYNALAVRMGFAEGAARVQDLFLAKAHREAAAAVPLDFIDQTSLIGSRGRIKDRLSRYAASGVTTLTIAAEGASLGERLHVVRTMAELLDESGLGD
jgi:alkanesulfonate monooxygenase SsuD/methylene tetrahydromethanopterin reductase-like flavin-dependent oxidoreductase (luciferase family)